MSQKYEQLKEKIKDFPLQPGVYLMKDIREKIIYVGKAKSLKNRVRSYFSESKDLSPKTRILVSQIVNIEYILTKTEVEAFLLEASLIKKNRPKYNIRLKDDKAYPYIRVSSGDKFPRLYLSRKVIRDGSQYFGPYTSGGQVHGTIRFLNRVFKIRDCTDHVFKSRQRPCMSYQIGRCSAPCVKYISQEDYALDVKGVLQFLMGKNQQLLKDLKRKMAQASEDERYEVAAKYRDNINDISAILERQAVINASSEVDQDVLSFQGGEIGTLIEILHVRQGRLLGASSHWLEKLNSNDPSEDVREWLVSFINQYYEDNIVPDEIILPVDLGLDIFKLLIAVLEERSSRNVKVRFATDEKGRRLIEMAQKNADSQFKKKTEAIEKKLEGLEEIKKKLHLPKLPERIECFDISHFQGKETVGSQVVFEGGKPATDFYRKYKIKSVAGVNDFASMYELLSRRLKHKNEDDPDLIVIDGGKGQLSVVERVLADLGREDIPLVSLAKSRTLGEFHEKEIEKSEERFFLPGRSNPVIFQPQSEAFKILVGIRDEAHRFAITFHRKLREASSLDSEMDQLTGLGEKRKKQLLEHFGSMDSIREASVDDIMSLDGFNKKLAESILAQLKK